MLRHSTLLPLALALCSASAATRAGGGIRVGDPAPYAFRAPLVNGLGLERLEDLRGRPVLVEFWGTRCPACVDAAVPVTLRLQEELGADLQVVFVESQATPAEEAEAFAITRRWMGGRSVWTSEAPFASGSRSLPYVVLLGVEGRVVFKGNPLESSKEIERLIGEQIQIGKGAPPGAPKIVRAAWNVYAKGKVGQALTALDSAAAEAAGNPELLDALAAAGAEFRRRTRATIARAAWMLDNGHPQEGADLYERTRLSLEGRADLEAELEPLRRRMQASGFEAEREAARLFERLLARYYDAAGDAELRRELERFAERYAGTQVGARAQRLLALPRR